MTNHNDRTTGVHGNERYFTHHHWDGDASLRESIIGAVATVTGADTETIAAHYGIEHSRIVERLFGDSSTDDPRSYGLIRFLLYGSIVTVHSDGRLTVAVEDDDAAQQPIVA